MSLFYDYEMMCLEGYTYIFIPVYDKSYLHALWL